MMTVVQCAQALSLQQHYTWGLEGLAAALSGIRELQLQHLCALFWPMKPAMLEMAKARFQPTLYIINVTTLCYIGLYSTILYHLILSSILLYSICYITLYIV